MPSKKNKRLISSWEGVDIDALEDSNLMRIAESRLVHSNCPESLFSKSKLVGFDKLSQDTSVPPAGWYFWRSDEEKT